MAEVIFRNYHDGDDIGAITALLHGAYGPLARMGFRFLATHQDEATTLRRLTRGFALIAEYEGHIIGTITLNPPKPHSRCPWYTRPEVYSFGQFAVHPDFQKQGLGGRLLQLAEARARAHSARELALDTAEGAVHLRQWYERLGFRFIEHVSWEETNYRSVVLSKKLDDRPDASAPPTGSVLV